MRRADYSRIASVYDKGRSLPDELVDLWIRLLSRYVDDLAHTRILDLGCGTGRFTVAMATQLRCHVTGADSSEEMLSKARDKDSNNLIEWDCQDAQNLTYDDESFDMVFMSHLLHHVDDAYGVIGKCFRILRPGGILLNRYGAMEHICDDPEHRFFPETTELDKARTPTIEQVESWFRGVGFDPVSSETIVQQAYASAEERLRKVKTRCTSVLTLISDRSFQDGARRMKDYIVQYPDDQWLLADKITLTSGRKKA